MAKKSKKARKPGRPKAKLTVAQIVAKRVRGFYNGVVRRVKGLFSFITN